MQYRQKVRYAKYVGYLEWQIRKFAINFKNIHKNKL